MKEKREIFQAIEGAASPGATFKVQGVKNNGLSDIDSEVNRPRPRGLHAPPTIVGGGALLPLLYWMRRLHGHLLGRSVY